MRRFVVAASDYWGEDANLSLVEAENLNEMAKKATCFSSFADLCQANGDGCPLYTIGELVMVDGQPELYPIEIANETEEETEE